MGTPLPLLVYGILPGADDARAGLSFIAMKLTS